MALKKKSRNELKESDKAPSTIEPLAALDLGSNSFHLVVANYDGNRIATVDKIKSMVRLADGLDSNGEISPDAMARAIECLQRFGQRLRDIPSDNVRIVGTNTLRKAKNSQKFLKLAQKALNHRIDIISGNEEARIIFMGVSRALDDNHKRRLVIDIGGGSTELILGKRFKPSQMNSLYMGCVSLSAQCFSGGELTAANYNKAVNVARRELEGVAAMYRKQGWDTAIGASGTMQATRSTLAALDISHSGITLAGIKNLSDKMLEAKTLSELSLPGLGKDRAPVFPGGLAIVQAIVEELGIESMRVSDGALREGLLVDMVGRVQHDDIREHTVTELAKRYHIDTAHAKRVTQTAVSLFDQVSEIWELTEPELSLALRWAATLHEIGLGIAHSSYHKHGAYLLEHMDMPGFSRLDQARLSLMVRLHRRKLILEDLPQFDAASTEDLLRLTIILRLSHLLHRSRTEEPLPALKLSAEATAIELGIPKAWFAKHSLTQLDLAEEANYLASLGMTLTVSVS